MIPFSAIVTPETLVFTAPDGKTHTITKVHPNYLVMRDTIKELQQQIRNGNAAEARRLHEKLGGLVDVVKTITEQGQGRVTARDGKVYFQGAPLHNAITERILWGMREGFDMTPYLRFLDNLMDNPSMRSVAQLYTFMEKNGMGISDDGHIIAYKVVRGDFKDCHTGTIDNSPGAKPSMPRNQVLDDPKRHCGPGLHVCSISYLPSMGSGGGNRVVICKINPRDVVSVPEDSDCAKVRCCDYEVIGEYTGTDRDDLLATRPVWKQKELPVQQVEFAPPTKREDFALNARATVNYTTLGGEERTYEGTLVRMASEAADGGYLVWIQVPGHGMRSLRVDRIGSMTMDNTLYTGKAIITALKARAIVGDDGQTDPDGNRL